MAEGEAPPVGGASGFGVSDVLVFRVDDQHVTIQVLRMGFENDVDSKDAEVRLGTMAVDALG